ncbi:hypothetical protein GCM10009780_73910 [Actinomadura alba]
MATQPAATAAANIPDLSTMVSAIKKAGLMDKMNSAKDITIFAPTNAAFAKIPRAELDKIMANQKALSDIMSYHIVNQRMAPRARAASSSIKTMEGGMLRISGSGDSLKVNDASVVCGDIPTANATIYMIDSVLTPQR